jgi:ribosome maturation factor RimP
MDATARGDEEFQGDELVTRLCKGIVESLGYELVVAEWRRNPRRGIVRVYVHRPGGITVGECQKLLRTLEPTLRVEGVVDDQTEFEVASPGLDRPLKTAADFVRATDQFVTVRRCRKSDPNVEERLAGKLTHASEAEIVLLLDTNEQVAVPLSEVVEGRFDVRFS